MAKGNASYYSHYKVHIVRIGFCALSCAAASPKNFDIFLCARGASPKNRFNEENVPLFCDLRHPFMYEVNSPWLSRSDLSLTR